MPLTDSNTADLQDAPDDGAPAARPSAGVIVKPVVNAVRILRYLTQKGSPERAADIARQLAINPSTCFNILRTLVSEDVVDFNPLSKTYSAGLGLARLMEQAGLSNVVYNEYMIKTVAIHVGTKLRNTVK